MFSEKDVAQYLADQTQAGHPDISPFLGDPAGLALAYNVFTGRSPDATVTRFAVTIRQYGGSASAMAMGGTRVIDYPRIQIEVRDDDPEKAGSLAQVFRNMLDGLGDVDFDSGKYYNVKALGDPANIGPDEQNLWRIVVNFEIARQPV